MITEARIKQLAVEFDIYHVDAGGDIYSAGVYPKIDVVQFAQAVLKEALAWQPMETVPTDGTAILVWLEKPMLRSRVHSATYSRNAHDQIMVVIGGVFGYDAPKPLAWMLPPKGPEA